MRRRKWFLIAKEHLRCATSASCAQWPSTANATNCADAPHATTEHGTQQNQSTWPDAHRQRGRWT
eukprot:1156355-Pelagomonas_calceolata.AAC.8